MSASLHGEAGTSQLPTFTIDLHLGSTGADVHALQVYFNSNGFPVAKSGPALPATETNWFGHLTKAALARFQAAVGITPAAGYFGPKTRAYLTTHP